MDTATVRTMPVSNQPPSPSPPVPAVPPEALQILLPYLSQNERSACKQACLFWHSFITKIETMALSSTPTTRVFHTPLIVDIIFKYLDRYDRLTSRKLTTTFDMVAVKYLNFSPILNDLTRNSIMKMESDLRIQQIRVAGLFMDLPTTPDDDGMLDCKLNRVGVKSLTFYEGVSKSNKEVLLRTFPNLEELKYISTTNFAIPLGIKLDLLQKLKVSSPVFDENGTLKALFEIGRFPALKTLELDIQARLDFSLYLETHNFVAVHLQTLKSLVLFFGGDFLVVSPDISNMFINFPDDLSERCNQISNIFRNNTHGLDQCHLKYLRCEGISRFNLTTALYDNMRSLNPPGTTLYSNGLINHPNIGFRIQNDFPPLLPEEDDIFDDFEPHNNPHMIHGEEDSDYDHELFDFIHDSFDADDLQELYADSILDTESSDIPDSDFYTTDHYYEEDLPEPDEPEVLNDLIWNPDSERWDDFNDGYIIPRSFYADDEEDNNSEHTEDEEEADDDVLTPLTTFYLNNSNNEDEEEEEEGTLPDEKTLVWNVNSERWEHFHEENYANDNESSIHNSNNHEASEEENENGCRSHLYPSGGLSDEETMNEPGFTYSNVWNSHYERCQLRSGYDFGVLDTDEEEEDPTNGDEDGCTIM